MATFTVTTTADSGAGSLRQAVLEANALSGRDVIVFDASFDGGAEDVIRLTTGQIEITDRLRIDGGPGVMITGDAAGDDVTDAAGITDVDASGAGRLDDNSRIFSASASLTLDGLTLTGGRTTDDYEGGGAVRSNDARLTLIDSVVSGNSSAGTYGYGGGIDSIDVTVRNSIVSGNSSTGGEYGVGGGGINGRGVVTVVDSTVSSNVGGSTGGISGLRGVTVTNSTVSSNVGGGISSHFDVTVRNSTVSGNHEVYGGGGIAGGNVVTVIRSTVSDNSGSYGGGILAGDLVTLTNSTVSGNRSYRGGGGVLSYGRVVATNSTISGNWTTGRDYGDGGGIYAGSFPGEAHRVYLTNSIVLGNRAINADTDEIFGTQILSGANIVGRDVFSGMSDIGDTTLKNVFAATVEVSDGVRAGRLADNGGPTRTIALNPDAFNPALGGANPAKAPAHDQRGGLRDAAPDLGAFEAAPVDGLVLLGRARAERLTGSPSDDQIYGRGGADTLLGRAGDDQLRGELGDDRLRGGNGHDSLDGGTGDDSLRGGSSSDQLSGGTGDDYLRGGRGDDWLFGGKGSDTFVFAGHFGHDAIAGFDARPSSGQDRIDLRAFEISPESFDYSVKIADRGEDTRVRVVIEGTGEYQDVRGTILCRGVSGDGENRIDAADFLI